MDPIKIGTQPFYIFSMKFMMWLDYASSKYPIPWLWEGRKKIWIFAGNVDISIKSHWISLHKKTLEPMNSLVNL